MNKKTKRSQKTSDSSVDIFNDGDIISDDEKEVIVNGKKYPTEIFQKFQKKKLFNE